MGHVSLSSCASGIPSPSVSLGATPMSVAPSNVPIISRPLVENSARINIGACTANPDPPFLLNGASRGVPRELIGSIRLSVGLLHVKTNLLGTDYSELYHDRPIRLGAYLAFTNPLVEENESPG